MKYRIELKWGLIFSAVSLVWALIGKAFALDSDRIEYNQVFNTSILIPAVVVYWLAAIDKRNNFYGGHISFKKSFISGMMLTLFITLLGIVTTLIATKLISPQLFDNLIAYTTANNLMTRPEAINQFNLTTYVVTGILAGPVTGLVFSTLVSLIIPKKSKKTASGASQATYNTQGKMVV
ncbi:DUF4199 domain-containing protein [Paraflavitalea soli]|uniref:DUF4199 domain-containing protein n=1 Tax=Paraflavitalea soli TaxID=2315862 RepID=A0A3B7MVA0_9BACT|nr:DUF4199 domain-containing protein [Paraflavitalea soli]AXY78018.1 DUF4199 domain-containing protein [Paraflavitalea soli]